MLVRAIGAQHLCIDTGRRGTGAQDVQLDESAATKAGWDRAGQLLILQTQNARAGTVAAGRIEGVLFHQDLNE